MFSKYYQSELSYLRELGREFALANPSTAGMLAERGGDPDVERLLEGFAFLTARIRERIDDDVPEIVHSLTDLLIPHYLRTIPACSIVEFTPISGALRGRHRIQRGSELSSVPVDGTPCRFRTTADVDLLPLTLNDVVLDTASPTNPVLRVQFQTTEQGRALVFAPDGIRLFIQGDPSVCTTLMLWLLRYCKSIAVRGLTNKTARPIQIDPRSVQPVGLAPNQALLPWPKLAPEGYRLIQEYFTLPAKFLFFDVRGLEAAASVGDDKFEIAFMFERPPQLPARINKEILRLNCTPVINLFSVDSDPLRRDPTIHEYMLRAAEIDPHHIEIYSVETVTGLQAGRADRKQYRPFFDFGHSAEAAESTFYKLRRATSPIDDGIDTFISISTPRDVAPSAIEETISVELVCTNRSAPAQLRVGDISVPTPGSPTVARFKNITAVTKPVRPPFGASLHWRLLSHLAINQRSLADPGVLRSALELYNFQGVVDRQAGRANRLRVEAIRTVVLRPVERHIHGVPVRGVGTTIEIDEANFAGEGDVFLFGAVLDELLATNASVNSFNELTIKLQPSQAEYSWPAKNGRMQIL